MVQSIRLSVVVVLVGFVLTMGASSGFSRENAQTEEKGLFPNGMPAPLAKLHRGVCNVLFSWMEVPNEIQAKSAQPERPYFIRIFNSRTVSTVDSMVAGTLLGTCKMTTRIAGGVTEGVLFLVPPYRPIMDPPIPGPLGLAGSTRLIYVECCKMGPFHPDMVPCMPGLGMAMKGCCPGMKCGTCPKMKRGVACPKTNRGACPKMKMRSGQCPMTGQRIRAPRASERDRTPRNRNRMRMRNPEVCPMNEN